MLSFWNPAYGRKLNHSRCADNRTNTKKNQENPGKTKKTSKKQEHLRQILHTGDTEFLDQSV